MLILAGTISKCLEKHLKKLKNNKNDQSKIVYEC